VDDEKIWLREVAIKSGNVIAESGFFIFFFGKSYKEEPLSALQLGIAIMSDHPVGVIGMNGAVIPDSLKNVAKAWVDVEKEDDFEKKSGDLIIKLLESVKGEEEKNG